MLLIYAFSNISKEVLRIEFGQRVKQSRENLNLSRKDFAEIIGISEYFLVQIELGKRGAVQKNWESLNKTCANARNKISGAAIPLLPFARLPLLL